MSKYSRQKSERYQCKATFPKAFIQEQWDAGKRFSFMHYNYEKNLETSFDELLSAGLQAANDDDHHLAVYYYTEALKVKPNSDLCYNNLAWSKYLLGQCSGALSDANKSIGLNAADYSYHTRASILMCLGRCHDAVSCRAGAGAQEALGNARSADWPGRRASGGHHACPIWNCASIRTGLANSAWHRHGFGVVIHCHHRADVE